MSHTLRWVVVATAAAVVVVAGAGVAIATSHSDEQSLSGVTLDEATQAALTYTGGGSVTEAEVGDQSAAYDVQVTRDDGVVVELRLDSSLAVISEENDHDEPETGTGDAG